MGLGFYVETRENTDARWSYSGFDHFRSRLAASLGLRWDEWTLGCRHAHVRAEWAVRFKGDPLLLLLVHSDCDGDLGAEECRLLAPRLREAVSGWSDDDYDKVHALRLASAMDRVAEESTRLVFS